MVNIENNPSFLNSFLDYTATILNKSPNTIKEYNYDLNNFLKFILYHFKLTNEKDIKNINIHDMTIETIKKITLDDIHAYLFYLLKCVVRVFIIQIGQFIHLVVHDDHEVRSGVVVVSGQGLFNLGEDGQALIRIAA